MAEYTRGGPVDRPADHSWVLTAWVLPLAIAIGFTIATFGFGAFTIAVAIVVGLVATVLHHRSRGE